MCSRPVVSWAQAATELMTTNAELPEEARLHMDRPTPAAPPMWGSIFDDVWGLEEDSDDASVERCLTFQYAFAEVSSSF